MRKGFPMAKQIVVKSRKYGDKIAIVDDDDFQLINEHKWRLSNNGYARTNSSRLERADRKQVQILMHKMIMEISDKKLEVDHKNRNKLDNRRENLRVATKTQNSANKPAEKRNKVGLKGVRLNHGKYEATIWDKKSIYLGSFNFKEEAHNAYKEAAIKLFGEFARW